MKVIGVRAIKRICASIGFVFGIVTLFPPAMAVAQDGAFEKLVTPGSAPQRQDQKKSDGGRNEGQTQVPLETNEILEQCINKLENFRKKFDGFSQRLTNWKQNNCAPKDEFEGLVGWRTLAKDLINTRISDGLKKCQLRLGSHGCQTLRYELTASALQVTGKLLDKECASKVFTSSVQEFSQLKLDLSGLSEQSDCNISEGSIWEVRINPDTQQADCVGRREADRSYNRLPPEKKCSELGKTVASWKSFSHRKRFWVLGNDDESVYLCQKSIGKSWRVKSSNLSGKCALLLQDKRKNPKAEDTPVVRLQAGRGGHFKVTAFINGHRTSLLVDTGATSVSLRYEDAVALGLASRLKFTNKAATANGTTSVAPVKIDRIQIGEIIVDNVDGSVSKRGALNQSLLGMSFIKRLSQFDMSGTTLTMAK